MLTFDEPHPVAFSDSVWFTLHAARAYAAAVQAAAAAEVPTCTRLPAWTGDEPTVLELQIATDTHYDGVYLDIGDFLVSRHHAIGLARAILAAADYLIAHSAPQ